MSSSTSPAALCTHWVMSMSSNVHVAKDRDWFTEYRPIQSFIGGLYSGGNKQEVVGLGVVELPVKQSLNRSGAESHGIFRLRNVLHVPSSLCNVVGGPACDDYGATSFGRRDNGTTGEILDDNGKRLAYLWEPPNGPSLSHIKLSGPPVGPVPGPSPFLEGCHYAISVSWSDQERQQYLSDPQRSTQNSNSANPDEDARMTGVVSEPYTSEEKAWINKHFGGEFKWLQVSGLNIHKDGDREKGRLIARALMSLGDDGEDDEDDEAEHTDEDDFMDNPEKAFADTNFSESELAFIANGWGNSVDFMLSYGLKFYKDEDCEEAKAILRAMMSDSGDEGDNDDYYEEGLFPKD